METWFKKNLGDAMLAESHIARIMALYELREQDSDLNTSAIFIRHESEGRLHCEVIVYFSPGLSAIAKTVNAQSCLKPSSDNLGLLAGLPDAWTALFSERE